MAAYNDVSGWQHKQFLGAGEFTLEFGNYNVAITAPADHIVSATGVLQNPEKVLTAAQRQRLEQARTAKEPALIVTPAEAKQTKATARENEKLDQRAEENLGFCRGECARFCFCLLAKVYLGRTGT